jgi:hypothetical protein
MDLHVAIGAGIAGNALKISCAGTARENFGAEGSTAMTRVVALLAKEGHTRLQHRRVVGPVGVMAVGTVVLCRAVFPKEGPAKLGVTLEAGFIDRVFLQRCLGGRTVRLMAG